MDNLNKIVHRYDHTAIEKKWQGIWATSKIDSVDIFHAKQPYFNLMMFPYPSAEGLHVGNMYAFTGSDIHGRFMRMQGYDVFEPIGLDGFGIHSENYALKVGRRPQDHARITEKHFFEQLHQIGAMFDWERTLTTYDPGYYRFTQWLFTVMFKYGLAYRKTANVNFCPSCKTVLADEQVVQKEVSGISQPVCERCGNQVEKKALEQWFFRITAYAEKLLGNIADLQWSEKVKIAQTNWIGKKEGIVIDYKVVTNDGNEVGKVSCFTTRPDTNFGATFIVLAPEHTFISQILSKVSEAKQQEIRAYQAKSKLKSEADRIAEGREKTGVDTGLYCVNVLNNTKMPLYISDFVLAEFGTGAVVGVPGHDTRDFEFAKVMNIPVIRVVIGKDNDQSDIKDIKQVQEDEGIMVNSGFLDGMDIHLATKKIMDYMEEKGMGKRTSTYHLRDWLISRQRYWGPPIPMIYCETCAKAGKGEQKNMPGWYTVPEEDLPVLLPEIEDYKPGDDGVAPLAKHKEFYEVLCPGCGGKARRETDVSDTFLDSSWYFLRYPSINIRQERKQSNDLPWDPEATKKWLPVAQYTGGAEHSVLHLLYSRFVTMALKDMGYVDFEEPFTNFFAHGMIIKDGAKMSKSKGNIVNPDEYIPKYGADALRLYLMFMGPLSEGGDFRDTGMEGMAKWVGRVWRLMSESAKSVQMEGNKELLANNHQVIHKTLAEVTKDMPKRRYNTAIAHLMECMNILGENQGVIGHDDIKIFLQMLAPFAPHLAEELWCRVEGRETWTDPKDSIFGQKWPEVDKDAIVDTMISIVIQVNGKVRETLSVDVKDTKNQDKLEILAKKSEKVSKYLSTGKLIKTIFVPGKLLNFVVA